MIRATKVGIALQFDALIVLQMNGIKMLTNNDFNKLPLPDRVRSFREFQRLSVDELAARVGVKGYTVRRWEKGTSLPSREAANSLTDLGIGPIDDNDTNLSSRSRGLKNPKVSVAGARPVPGMHGATFPTWVANGPADQEGFYSKLIELQRVSGIAPERLSIVDQTGQGSRTMQAQLEQPKATASSWSSNYGSHGWHRYVGRFPPHVVRSLINHFGLGPNSLVCDPFSGSGTTAVECRLLGIPFIGIEIGALSHLMGKVKSKFDIDTSLLDELINEYAVDYREIERSFINQNPPNFSVHDVLNRNGNSIPNFSNVEKWFNPEAFLGTSITVEIARNKKTYQSDVLLLALSAKMRSIGNVDVDVVRAEYSKKPRDDVDVLKIVTRQLMKMKSDIDRMAKTHSGCIGSSEIIHLIEGSALSVEIAPESVDAIITSPPYGVEALSYLRTHLLSYRSLASELHHDPYDVREQTIGSEYLEEAVLPKSLKVEKVSPTFSNFFRSLPKESDKKSRQRRAAMMKFFEDMHEMGLRMSNWLKDGGHVAWVIGNKKLGDYVVPTDKIIEESFNSSGIIIYDIMRHKLKTNNSNSQVPWQERIIQEESTMLFKRASR